MEIKTYGDDDTEYAIEHGDILIYSGYNTINYLAEKIF